MFRSNWTIARVRGIPIRLHISLLAIVPLMGLQFAAQGLRGLTHQLGFTPEAMAIPSGAWAFILPVLVFVSVLFHELGHALVALKQGGRVQGITLMLLGGLTEIDHEEATPKQQAWMAAAGPLVSLALALLGAMASLALFSSSLYTLMLIAVLTASVNAALCIFNLLPAYPLDGGRILKALLERKRSSAEATRIAASVGRGMAILMAIVAVLGAFDPFLLLIAAFIFMGASVEVASADLKDRLVGLRAEQAMIDRVASVDPDRPATAVARHMLLQGAQAAIVRDFDGLYGVLLPRDLKRAGKQRVHEILPPKPLIVHTHDDLGEVARKLLSGGRDRPSGAVVINEMNTLVGVITHEGLARALTLRTVADSSLPPEARVVPRTEP